VVVDLEKEKEEIVHDRTLAVGCPNSPWRVWSIIAKWGATAKKGEEQPDAAIGSSGHSFRQADAGVYTRLDA
jgi:hypothetical protein